jgi:RES domain-containing protein
VGTVVAFRLANWDTPLWASPNRRESRYAVEGSIVQYWSLHPLTCWAEHLRFHGVRIPDEATELLARPWVASLDVPDGVLDVSFENAKDHGIDAASLVDDDWTACQHWAGRLRADGLIVPSAALPGTRNLVLFGPRVRVRYGVPPLDPMIDLPCDPVADLGVTVADLLPHVRWRGMAHAGYEAWARGEPEPPPPSVHVDRS